MIDLEHTITTPEKIRETLTRFRIWFAPKGRLPIGGDFVEGPDIAPQPNNDETPNSKPPLAKTRLKRQGVNL